MDGLPVFYGNPISAHADRNLDLIGVGSLLALSPQDDLNVLASLRYRGEFGFNAIYTLPKGGEKNNDAKHRSAAQHRGHILFGEQISYQKLASLLSKGAEIRSTPLTENFDYAAYREQHGKNAIPLFALDQKERLRVFVVGNTLKPVAGWVILSLIQAKAEQNGSTPTPKSA